jgi:predicted amidophosphoribosyltransferase
MSVRRSNVVRKMTSQLSATFPGCLGCEYLRTGPAERCSGCVRPVLEQPAANACTVCSQRVGTDGRCRNELCHSPRRQIARIHAIAYQSGSLRRAISAYKYRGVTDWSMIFGRLLIAWLDEALADDPPDLIVANPSFVGPRGQRFAHTEAVIESAALAAAARPGPLPQWQFDTADPRAIVKVTATLKSADVEAWSKHASAVDLRDALRVPDTRRTSGRHILVYDDICTTGGQLDAVAACLREEGGASRVDGIVLARAPWRSEPQQGIRLGSQI